jgi:membrane associated rhomboid family serine protease
MSSREKKSAIYEFQILAGWLVIFWIVELIDFFFFHGKLDKLGIRPHTIIGLRGILFAPFLHGGFGHLIANTIPFFTLGWLTMIQETSDLYIVSLITMVIGGLGVWLFASPGTIHIGASILIYGYLGFLLFRGYFQKNLPSIILSIVVLLLYGSLIWGVFPARVGVSWQGHLFGFIGGAIAAWMIAKEKKFYG